jgi:hypothetical protein
VDGSRTWRLGCGHRRRAPCPTQPSEAHVWCHARVDHHGRVDHHETRRSPRTCRAPRTCRSGPERASPADDGLAGRADGLVGRAMRSRVGPARDEEAHLSSRAIVKPTSARSRAVAPAIELPPSPPAMIAPGSAVRAGCRHLSELHHPPQRYLRPTRLRCPCTDRRRAERRTRHRCPCAKRPRRHRCPCADRAHPGSIGSR